MFRARKPVFDGALPPPLEIGDDDMLLIGTKRRFSNEQLARFRHAWGEAMRGPRPRVIVLDPDMFVAARMRRADASYSARFGDCG